MLRTKKEGTGGFPKGTPEPGELLHETAARELLEETGVSGAYIDQTTTFHERYRFIDRDGNTWDKTVMLYPAIVEQMTMADEIDAEAAEWLTLEKAADRLTHDSARNALAKLKDYILTKI